MDQIDRVSVSMDGLELPVETERDDSRFVIRWGHRPINPPENLTFILRYRVRGAIEIDQDSDLDSVTWEALFGNRKRGATIERAVVTLRLPGGLPPQLRRQESFGVDADSRWLDARTVEFIPRKACRVPVGWQSRYLSPTVWSMDRPPPGGRASGFSRRLP